MSRFRRVPWREAGLLVLLFVLALAVRVYGLRLWPPGLYNDEAANGIDALNVLKGYWPVFFEGNNGREPLFIYLQALSIAVFGPNAFALRLTAAVLGALTIPAVYWMTREMFARTDVPARWLALWTALFLAFSYWHISLSRVGFRAIMLPLVAAIAFGWFWRAWWRLDGSGSQEEQSAGGNMPYLELIFCGGFVGLSLYTYTAARFIPFVIVLFALVAAGLPPRSSQRARRIGLALAVIAGASLVVFIPLGAYYLSHPGSFAGRATTVSVLSPEFAVGGPVVSLARSALGLGKMFFATPDPNLRHNPAQRPVFDLLMALWLGVGVAIAVIRWRVLPYTFLIVWLLLLSLPAVLTAEGVPHSLRAIGILPPAILFAVLAMFVVGQQVLRRRRTLALWLPLPFLLFSGLTGLRDYFHSWEDIDGFRDAFQLDLIDLANLMTSEGASDTVWILSVSPSYNVSDAEFYTPAFFAGDRYAAVLADEQEVSADMADATRGKRYANAIVPQATSSRADMSYVFGDPKHLVRFLLDKHGRWMSEVGESDAALTFTRYELPSTNQFQVAGDFEPVDVVFDDKVKAIEVDYGRTALDLNETPDALESRTGPAGHSLWVVLHWQALVPIDVDLKASLYLKDEFGNVAGQVDDLLVGDLYPRERVWEPGENAGTYHIVPTLAGIPPGRYGLYLKVYEDQTLRPYPVTDEAGDVQGPDTLLGYVDVTRPANPVTVSPETALPSNTAMGPDLALLGYDLPMRDLRPGDSVPLTLYWEASDQPVRDYTVRVELRDSTGDAAVIQEMSPANGTYPSSEWQQGEIVRDWHRIPISNSLASGVYDLVVAVTDGGQALAEIGLGQVVVKGHPRLMEPPPLSEPLPAVFGERVALLGVIAPEELRVAPGDTLTLSLGWQALASSTAEIVRFVHVLGPDGRPVSQSDGIPCQGECVPASWAPGEVLVDEISLQIPAELPAGRYPLGVGWYDAATVQRLEALDQNGQPLPNNMVLLPSLEVLIRDK